MLKFSTPSYFLVHTDLGKPNSQFTNQYHPCREKKTHVGEFKARTKMNRKL